MSSTPQTITAKLTVGYVVNETLSYGAVPTTAYPAVGTISSTDSYQNGTSATAAAVNLHFEDGTTAITLTPSSSQTFTLSSLTDGLGRNFSMAGGVRILTVQVTARTAGDYLELTPGASHGWTAMLKGTSPGIVIWDVFAVGVLQTDGYAITAGSNDQFTITNQGVNNITFEIGIAGCNS